MSSHSFSAPRTPVAKKMHTCIWCWNKIVIGERYYRFVGVGNGDFQNWSMHSDCQAACERETVYYEYYDDSICEERHLRGMTCQDAEHIKILEEEIHQLKQDVNKWRNRWANQHKTENINRWDWRHAWDDDCKECIEARSILGE